MRIPSGDPAPIFLLRKRNSIRQNSSKKIPAAHYFAVCRNEIFRKGFAMKIPMIVMSILIAFLLGMSLIFMVLIPQ